MFVVENDDSFLDEGLHVVVSCRSPSNARGWRATGNEGIDNHDGRRESDGIVVGGGGITGKTVS